MGSARPNRQHGPVLPMLAVPAERAGGLPADGELWAYEVKWDGMRVLADVRQGRVRLTSRRGNDVTVTFPELAGLAVAHQDVLLDGEVVVLRGGVPSFAALAERFHVRDARRAAALAKAAPATFIAFDVLRLYGVDLAARPWQERRKALERLAPTGTAWQLSPVYDDGPALLEATREQGLEGVVAKRRASPYREGARTADWVKLAHQRVQSCVVGGWRPETDDPSRVGSLLLGLWSQGPGPRVLRYAGKAGSGLATASQDDVKALLASVATKTSPFDPPVPRPDVIGAQWLLPRLVVDVRHLGHTDGGRLRQPVVQGFRADLAADDVREEG
jgi:bifunctional non-homologous end joining protein LigD